MNTLFLVIFAAIAGISCVIQGHFMGIMDQKIGSKESVFITYAGGGLLVGLMMLFVGGGNLNSWPKVPWYALTAGIVGLIIVGSIGYTMPRLGLTKGFTVVIAAQLLAALAFDQFGLLGATVRPMNLERILGGMFLVLGSWLILR
jgi:bacterial/archaeal transporter family-2 protein